MEEDTLVDAVAWVNEDVWVKDGGLVSEAVLIRDGGLVRTTSCWVALDELDAVGAGMRPR